MKRSLSILLSTVLALSCAPHALALSSAVAAPADISNLSASGDSRAVPSVTERKKICVFMCIQSTLPAIDIAAHFVNENSGLLIFNERGVELRDLDSKSIARTMAYPYGVIPSTVMSAVSADGQEVLFYAVNSQWDEGQIYRVSLRNLQIQHISSSPTHGLTYPLTRSLTLDPNHGGYYLIHNSGSNHYLCSYDAVGREKDCSSSFSIGSEISPIFVNADGTKLSVWGGGDKRYEFTPSSHLEMTTTTISGLTSRTVDFEHGSQASDGDVFFLDRNSPGHLNSVTRVYQIRNDGHLIDSIEIAGEFAINDVVVPSQYSDGVYLLGVGANSSGVSNSFETIHMLDGVEFDGTLRVKKTLNIKPNSNSSLPTRLAIDNFGRYLLTYGNGTLTNVVPAGTKGSVWAITDSQFKTRPFFGRFISWDFINLGPGKKVTEYIVYSKEAGARKWKVWGKFPSSVDYLPHLYSFGPEIAEVKIVPKGINLKSTTTTSFDDSGVVYPEF